jgi:hypothetical protein
MVAIVISMLMVAGESKAGVFCLDLQSGCNDIKLFMSDRDGEITEVHGYEYGCGDESRGLSGVKIKSGTHRYYNLSGSYNDGSQVASISIDYDRVSDTYSGSWSYISDTVIEGSGTYTRVPCPSAETIELQFSEPDLTY